MTAATRHTTDGPVATITLDSPHNRNALSVAMLNALGDDLGRAVADPQIRVVVITNSDSCNTFCAGADLSGEVTGEPPRFSMTDVMTTIVDSPKPIVGRIAGHCAGGGVGIAAACDISIVADDVSLRFSEVRIGVAPAIISVICLDKISRAHALELFLTGDPLTAPHAVEIGLVNRSVPRHQLDEAVGAVVASLLLGGPNAQAASKALVNRVPRLDRPAAFAWTERLSADLFASAEAAAGMAAFRNRKAARWVPVPDEE